MRKIFGSALAMVGLGGLMTLSENPEAPETFTRTFIALVICLGMFILGVWLARWFDGQQDPKPQAEDAGYSKNDDHNPYPED